MFKKPFKVKSNTQVKGSERKHLKELLLRTFSNLTEDEVNDFMPKKEVINLVKISTWDEEIVQIYTVQKRAMLFEVRNVYFPTVYFLWKFPNLVYSFTTHPDVMNYITSGADLMLPGVCTPPSHTNLPKYGNLPENSLATVNLSTNKAVIAVGKTCQSSQDMVIANQKGRCVNILHFYGDKLCSLDGLANLPVPKMPPPDWLSLKSYDSDFPALGEKPSKPSTSQTSSVEESVSEEQLSENKEDEEGLEEDIETDSVENMDELLKYCFLGALKYSKELALPCLTSNFFKLHMLPVCPPNKSLDIKKSSYKKLKPFLEKMAETNVITIKEVKKGVEAISAINKNNPMLCEFYMKPEDRPSKQSGEQESPSATNVTESFIITPSVLPIFQSGKYQKGDTILGSDVRKFVVQYVKDNNCQDENNPKLVKPKALLATICKTESPITWEELIEKVCEAMKSCFKVSSGGEEVLNKGKVSPITMTVSVRSGNKKVTLVDNLELFGIRVNEFAKECQHGVAASTSISRPPGKKSDQLLVQGNQVLFIYNLLTDKYKVPKKYIKGLENAPKKKK